MLDWITLALMAVAVCSYVWSVWNHRHRYVSITLQRGMEKVMVEGLSPEGATKEAHKAAMAMWGHRLRLPGED